MIDYDMTLLTSRMKIILAPENKANFKEAIHVMPQRRLNVPVIVKYLRNIDAPVAKWKTYYATVTTTVTNHALTECSYQTLGAISNVETDMLLFNYVTEQ